MHSYLSQTRAWTYTTWCMLCDCIKLCTHQSMCVFYCVFQGMFSARGKRLLFADADGASTFADVAKLEAELVKINSSVVCIMERQMAICVNMLNHVFTCH